jgi:hypothetical protein
MRDQSVDANSRSRGALTIGVRYWEARETIERVHECILPKSGIHYYWRALAAFVEGHIHP